MQVSYNDGKYNYVICKKCNGVDECDECERGLVHVPHECMYPECEEAFRSESAQLRHMRLKHFVLTLTYEIQ